MTTGTSSRFRRCCPTRLDGLLPEQGLKPGDSFWQGAGYEADEAMPGTPSGTRMTSSPIMSLQEGFARTQMALRPAGSAWVFAAGGIDFVRTLSDPTMADPRAQGLVANILFRALGYALPGLVTFSAPVQSPQGPFASNVTTFAGLLGQPGNQDGPKGQAQLSAPVALAALPDGGFVVLDQGAGKIKRVDATGAVQSLTTPSLWGPGASPPTARATSTSPTATVPGNPASGHLGPMDSLRRLPWKQRASGRRRYAGTIHDSGGASRSRARVSTWPIWAMGRSAR